MVKVNRERTWKMVFDTWLLGNCSFFVSFSTVRGTPPGVASYSFFQIVYVVDILGSIGGIDDGNTGLFLFPGNGLEA